MHLTLLRERRVLLEGEEEEEEEGEAANLLQAQRQPPLVTRLLHSPMLLEWLHSPLSPDNNDGARQPDTRQHDWPSAEWGTGGGRI